VNCIAVKDFSRFGRNAIETGYFIERVFPLFRVRFISVSDGFDSVDHGGDTGGMEVAFKFLMHEYYSIDLSKKIKSAKREKMRRGEAVRKNCVFGYKLNEKRLMIIDEPAADTVRLIYSLALENKSLAQIAKRLYGDKRPTPGEHKKHGENPSCIWGLSVIRSILHEEQYTGTYIAGRTKIPCVGSRKPVKVPESDWVKIPGHHPAIIEKSLYDAVCAVIRIKGEPRRKRQVGTWQRYKDNGNPLRGKVVCGCCGHVMTLSSTANPRFQCNFTRTAADAECHRLSISANKLADNLFGIIGRQTRAVLNADEFDGIDPQTERESEYAGRIARANDEKRELYERFILGEISAEGYKTAKTALDAEISRLVQTRAALASETTKMTAAKALYGERRRIADRTGTEKTLTSATVDTLIDRVLVYPGGRIEIEWKFADYFKNVSEDDK
jgi:hypothetical protein